MRKWMTIVAGFAASVLMFAAPVNAQSNTASGVAISKAVYVERVAPDGRGRSIEPANRLISGDRVVLVMEWDAADARRGFTLSSAVPRHLTFRRGDSGLQVSTNGGRNWGVLGQLRHNGRLATPEDVTHLRWRISGARSTSGSVTYSATVR